MGASRSGVSDGRPEDGDSTAELSPEELIKRILSEFDSISEERLYKLAFLIELAFYERNKKRLTEVGYSPVFEGVESTQLENALDQLIEEEEAINQYTVRVGSEQVPSIKIDRSELEKNISEYGQKDMTFEQVAQEVLDQYGKISKNSIDSVFQTIQIYRETPIGDNIDIEDHPAESGYM